MPASSRWRRKSEGVGGDGDRDGRIPVFGINPPNLQPGGQLPGRDPVNEYCGACGMVGFVPCERLPENLSKWRRCKPRFCCRLPRRV